MPSKAPKVKGKQKPQEEQREESLQAVILADSYEPWFTPFTLERPRCLLPLTNTPLIEYTLEFLAHAGVHDIFVYCGSHTEQVEKYINASKWKLPSSPFKRLLLLKSDATSVGDAMRDLDNRGLITDDFLLVNGDLVSNISIEPALERHRGRREKDKNAIMTMILREAGIHHRTKATNHKPVFISDPTADRCLHFEEIHASGNRGRHISLDPDLLSAHAEIEIREDLIDCQIDICTPDVLGLWSDNFDYQSVRTSFLFGVLKDYELHGKTIHMHILADQYAARIRNLRAYDAVSRDMMGRWTYPLCPDSNRARGQNYRYTKNKTYQESGVSLSRTGKVGPGCVLGRDTVIREGATVRGSTLGRNCQIGRNVHIEGSYLWDNVVVGDGSTIKKAVIAEGAVIGKGCTVEAGALVSFNVRVADNITIKKSRKITRAKLRDSGASERTDIAIVGDEGEGYEYAAHSDDGSDASNISKQLYRNPQASESASSVSTLQSEELDFEQAEDRSRRPSFMSETSDESAPNKDFHVEATASILDGLQKEDLPENIFLELNAFRMTLDASQHEVRRAVVAAFIRRITSLESNGVGAREAVNRVFSKYRSVIERIVLDKETDDKPDQVDFMLCVQRELVARERGENYLLFVAKEVYDLELVEEDGILKWWVDARSTEGGMGNVRGLTQQFISFLEEAEEDESEEDENDE
ncbi:MAG: hypothetical protein LQ343_001419 [Gyalolechia ehrenbergii]|nr:MAG: hypothetical protein LQ343_001419 [Gyalolechia ehrenbergii]